MMDNLLACEQLEPHINKSFLLLLPDLEPLPLVLMEVERLPERPSQTVYTPDGIAVQIRSDPFKLLLKGPLNPQLRHQTYTLQHAALGQLDGWFMVAVGRDETGILYEVIFN